MLEGVDAVMMLRLQRERMEEGLVASLDEYHTHYGLNAARLRRAAPMQWCCTPVRSTEAWKSPTRSPTVRNRWSCDKSATA